MPRNRINEKIFWPFWRSQFSRFHSYVFNWPPAESDGGGGGQYPPTWGGTLAAPHHGPTWRRERPSRPLLTPSLQRSAGSLHKAALPTPPSTQVIGEKLPTRICRKILEWG